MALTRYMWEGLKASPTHTVTVSGTFRVNLKTVRFLVDGRHYKRTVYLLDGRLVSFDGPLVSMSPYLNSMTVWYSL